MLGGMYGIDLDVSMLILDICIIIYIYIYWCNWYIRLYYYEAFSKNEKSMEMDFQFPNFMQKKMIDDRHE